jgi:hypothetical protein
MRAWGSPRREKTHEDVFDKFLPLHSDQFDYIAGLWNWKSKEEGDGSWMEMGGRREEGLYTTNILAVLPKHITRI